MGHGPFGASSPLFFKNGQLLGLSPIHKYSSLRQSFFTETQKICKNFSTLTQDAQFFWLMNNESEDVIILFSNYIYDCFKLRDV